MHLCPTTHAYVGALAGRAGGAMRGRVRRLRDFAAIREYFSDRETDELQAAIDARREARTGDPAPPEPRPGAGAESPPIHPTA